MNLLRDAVSMELLDDAGTLLARAPIATSGFKPGSGGFVAKLLRSIALASGDAVTFRIIASNGSILEAGPIGLTDRRITEGEAL